jgi:hypothetical protein
VAGVRIGLMEPGMGNREWGIDKAQRVAMTIPDSPFPIPAQRAHRALRQNLP